MRSSDIGSDGVDLVPNQCAGLEAGPAVPCDLIHNPDNMIFLYFLGCVIVEVLLLLHFNT